MLCILFVWAGLNSPKIVTSQPKNALFFSAVQACLCASRSLLLSFALNSVTFTVAAHQERMQAQLGHLCVEQSGSTITSPDVWGASWNCPVSWACWSFEAVSNCQGRQLGKLIHRVYENWLLRRHLFNGICNYGMGSRVVLPATADVCLSGGGGIWKQPCSQGLGIE